jgi:2-methylcitrate dehydratase PrpD
LLDAVGVMLAASGISEDIRPFIDLAAEGKGSCSILGTGRRTSATLAAMANGAMAHALDYEDALDAAPCHPNASLMPAAIALAQRRGDVTGAEFVTALAIGCDVACRMAVALRTPMEAGGWYPPPILGLFGATAAAARIARLDAERTRHALSLALCHATCPGEIKYSAATTIRAVREAFPAEAAVKSVLLAERGVIGFEEPLEGRSGFYALFAAGDYSREVLLEGLGTRFWGEELSFKLWPACRGTHPFIGMALDWRERPEADPDEIERIAIEIGDVQTMLVEPRERKIAPSTVIDAKFSIPFTLALALRRGRVTLDDFSSESLEDPRIRDLAGRVEVLVRPEWDRSRAASGAMTISFKNGSEARLEASDSLGSPSRPVSTEQLAEKFINCAMRAAEPLTRDQATRLSGKLLSVFEAERACEALGDL